MIKFDFKGKIIIVTGAGGNLGSAVVEAFLQGGGIVCGLYHQRGTIESSHENRSGCGELHQYDGVDVTDRKELIALGERIQKKVDRADVVVNTVGGFTMGERVHEISLDTWKKIMDLNVLSLLNAAAAFIPAMLENNSGKMITIGSGASLKGAAKSGPYAAAKGAVLRLTESMAAELQTHNIQVNCVLPGTIDTPENRQSMPNADFTKWVTPEQVAESILFLSSSASNAINGAGVPVYGRS